MKTKFFKIKKIFKKENFEINPDIYWRVVVIVFLLLTIASFVFAYNLFVQINDGDISSTQNNSEKVGNKEKGKIEDALNYFSEREKKSTEILNSSSSIVDPSL